MAQHGAIKTIAFESLSIFLVLVVGQQMRRASGGVGDALLYPRELVISCYYLCDGRKTQTRLKSLQVTGVKFHGEAWERVFG